jgi:hypothetical protein
MNIRELITHEINTARSIPFIDLNRVDMIWLEIERVNPSDMMMVVRYTYPRQLIPTPFERCFVNPAEYQSWIKLMGDSIKIKSQTWTSVPTQKEIGLALKQAYK